MVFNIAIDVENDAFKSESDGSNLPGPELARILRNLADELEDGAEVELGNMSYEASLRDANGNSVGYAKFLKGI